MEQTAQRVDRLLRSLVGIEDLRPSWGANGALSAVHILRNDAVTDHQLVRNIVSGLHAAFGMRVEPSAVRIYADGAVFATATSGLTASPPVAERPADCAAAAPEHVAAPSRHDGPVANGNGAHVPTHTNGRARHLAVGGGDAYPSTNGATRHVNGSVPVVGEVAVSVNGNGRRNGDHSASRNPAGAGRSAEPSGAAATPDGRPFRLERLSLDRHGTTLRCRVVLAGREATYSAIAEVPDAPAAELELAARVTVDAVRASMLTSAALDGVAITHIGNDTYVVAALRTGMADAPHACAARLVDSLAHAAAQAVLNAVAAMTVMNPIAPGRTAQGVRL